MDARRVAVAIWQAGVDAVGGYAATRAALGEGPPPDRILAVGKAAAAMARAALDRFGPVPCLVVTKYGHGSGLPGHVHLIEAAHPVPDAHSLEAGRALRAAVAGMDAGARLLLLVSGGASSLAEDLADGRTLDDLAALNRRLLAGGMDIGAMNTRRRTISTIKGGGLLAGFRGRSVEVLAISDVPGDDPMVIGSGIGAVPADAQYESGSRIIASNAHARRAAAAAARAAGLAVLAEEEALHEDLNILAATLGARIAAMDTGALILGGEPTAVLPPEPGRGGRNQALGLALAREIAGRRDLVIVVGGTDGTDGPTEAAGAIVDGDLWQDGAESALAAADSGSYLASREALLITGPTGTNVMDLLIAVRI